uniref:DUF7507 domain-containing protein n=1 Tax=Desulfatiglans anilini TaxID=90728 RepID=UPI0005596DEB
MKKWFAVHFASRMWRAIFATAFLSWCFAANASVWAANPAPVQLFYVPIPEDQLLTALQSLQSTGDEPENPVQTYVSIAAIADNTLIYYDQWENGYDLDIANPTNVYNAGNLGGTQIWGDNDPSNGIAPGFAVDKIDAGDVIILNNAITTSDLAAIDFDGRDKIAATKTIAVSRAGWASGSQTLLAGANEVFDTSNWGTEYRVPVGEDIPSNQMYDMFQYTGMTIMAGPGGAVVELDIDDDGSIEATVSLAEGQGHLIDGGINVGGRVVSNRPVQIDLITGDINGSYEARFYRLLPVALWSSSSYTPVSTPSSVSDYSGTGTTVWLYNPHGLDITVRYQRRSGGSLTTSDLTVPAGEYLKQVIPNGTGAHFYTDSDEVFYALTTIDSTDNLNGGIGRSGNRVWDWGFTLVPEDSLTPQVLIGLGIGRDPTSSQAPTENGSPIWVTPVGNGDTPVTIFIDFDANPTTGPNIDPNGNQYDASITLTELQTAKIYDSDGDQTRTLVYTFEPGVKLAAAWGEDPLEASVSQPGLDMGTGIPPLPLFDVSKSAALETDNDQDGFISPGDVLKYTILITNISRAPVPDILLIDNLPLDTTYVAGSTFFKNASEVTNPIPDDGVGTAFPLDEGGRILDDVTALIVGGSYEVTFKVLIDSFENLGSETSEIINTGLASAVGTKVRFEARTPLFGRLGNFVWSDTNGNGLQDVGEAGVNGLTVRLLDAGENLIATALTADDGGGNPGYYEFKGLLTGNYIVEFAAPNGCLFTTKNADGSGIDGAFNSDANPSNGRTDLFFLKPGQNNPNIDAGIICPAPGLTLDKTTTTASYDGAGDIISYQYKLTNSGNVPLQPPYAVLDNKVTVTCPQTPDPLAPGAFLTCTAQYAVSQADLDLGSVTNTATASATYGDSPVTSNQDQVTVPGIRTPGIELQKTGTLQDNDGTPGVSAGDTISYTFSVKNTGNVTLTNVTITDPKITVSGGPIASLAPGVTDSTTFTGSYTLTQTDINAGTFTNIATATGTPPSGGNVTDTDD